MFPVHALNLIVLAAEEGTGSKSLFDIANGLITGATGVVQAAFLLGAIIVVGATYFVTRAFVPVLVAIVLAAGVLWGVNSAPTIRDSAITTVDEAPQPGTAEIDDAIERD
jgi:hypothetical protein